MKVQITLVITVAGMLAFGTPVRFEVPQTGRPVVACGVEARGEAGGGAVTSWKTSALPDGWTTLTSGAESVDVLVLNGVAVEGGRLAADATWTDAKVHVVRHDVIVPSGVALTVGRGAIVKFLPETRIWIEAGGKLKAEGAQFADFRDDSVGGDTNMDGDLTEPSGSAWWWDDPLSTEIVEYRKPTHACESWVDHGLVRLRFGGEGVATPFEGVWNANGVFGDGLPIPEPRKGFTFAGWITDKGELLGSSSIVPCNDTVCMASWVEDQQFVPLTLAGVLDEAKLADVTIGGAAEWLPIEDETAKVGGSCAVSGTLDENGEEESIWLEAKVYGQGTLTFWWRVSCEPDPRAGKFSYDYAAFEADDEVVVRKDGESDWVQVTKTFTTEGEHVIRWTYNTDGWPSDDYDGCVWVDGVTWSGSAAPEEQTKPTIKGDEGATVTGDAETGFVVKPSEGKTAVEVSIPDGIDAGRITVELSAKVESVKPNGAKVKIVSDGADITEFLNVPAADGNGVIDLTKATVKEEIVKEAMDVEKGAVIDLSGGSLGTTSPTITTAPTHVGLFYTFSEGRTLGGMERSASKPGDGKPWSPEITVKGGNSAFYSIGVEKGE